MTRLTDALVKSPLFQYQESRASLAYERAQAITRTYDLTVDDVLNMSPKFWQMHMDPIVCVDPAATTHIMYHSLFVGTLARLATTEHQQILHEALLFRISGLFCLTEVGHGLDAIHIETTATLLPSGDIELHTPHDRAAKHMPPTAPAGLPATAVVFARAIFHGEDRGIKPFLVPISDGYKMCPGVSCKVIPHRPSYHTVNHSLTYFNRVRLPRSALLGSDEMPANHREAFLQSISRVASGGLAVACLAVPYLQLSSSIAARYSLRRHVVDPSSGKLRPIIYFRTQQIPVLTALVQSFVLRALQLVVTEEFTNVNVDVRVRHGLSAISKVATIQQVQSMQLLLSDRCGAQGLYSHNQIIELHIGLQGAAIAEGDILALSIRLATELLIGRYSLPPSANPNSLLARHEAGLFEELRAQISAMTHHRTKEFNDSILPHCMPLIEAIGHRMAYDAAVKEGLPSYMLDLYTASVVKLDRSWYVEHAGLSRRQQDAMERVAVDAAADHLQEMVDQIGADPYITAPIVSDELWDKFVGGLEIIGDSRADMNNGIPTLQNLARL